MELELVLTIIAFALFGGVVWLLALPVGCGGSIERTPERIAWWRLVLPLLGGALVLAFLLGWAVQEADPADERAGVLLHALALLSGGVVLRASVRAALALRLRRNAYIPIGTIGVWRPRVVVSREFRASVTDEVLAAALAHESAHVRNRDPLRIWFAQFAADLQWPVPGAAQRFSTWLLALEADRDDEALAGGVASEDLAEGILAAMRLHRAAAAPLCAQVAGDGEGIAWRVRRLFSDRAAPFASRRGVNWGVPASCVLLMTAALWLGVHYGDAVLGVLPGMGP